MDLRPDGLCNVCMLSPVVHNPKYPANTRYCTGCYLDIRKYGMLRRKRTNLTVAEMNFVMEMNEKLDNMDFRYPFTGRYFRP